VPGQTLIIDTEGALVIGDGLGGEFYWSASSIAADDGINVIKPTAAGASGRYLRIPLGASGSFIATTPDLSSGTTSGPVFYTRLGNLVTLTSNTTFTGPSASITFSLANPGPSILWPTRGQSIAGLVPGAADNTVACLAAIQVLGSNILLSKVAAGAAATSAWTAAGTKTMPPFTITYSIA